ncbi:MAG: M14 family zinc carboxypeptidase [candidate division WOR-3 bacterium]
MKVFNPIIILGLTTVMLWPFTVFAIDPRYHTYGEMVDEMVQASLDYPEICRLHIIGHTSFFHLPIFAMKISDNPDLTEDEPRLLFNGIHHATELMGVEVCLYMMHNLLSRYDTSLEVRAWVDSNEIWLVPMVNPDGHYINFNVVQDSWRKNARDNNGNGVFDPDYDGVDLNRNYDFLWHLGDPNPASREYRGPAPFSELETQAIRDLAHSQKFVFDICYHSDKDPRFGESVYYPWLWGSRYCPDIHHIRPIAESIAYRIPNDMGSAPYTPIWGDATDGGLARNWLYYAIGTFPFTIEISTSYQPPGYRVDSLCEKVMQGSYYLFKRILGPGITGHITDAQTGEPVPAEVRVLEAYAAPETIRPRYADSIFGRYQRILKPGYYTLQILAPGYETVRMDSVLVTATGPTVLDIQLPRVPGIFEEKVIKASRQPNNLVLPIFIKGKAKIHWQILNKERARLFVFDNNGKKICTIFDKIFEPGSYVMEWDCRDKKGSKLSSGIYFFRLESKSKRITQKITISQ